MEEEDEAGPDGSSIKPVSSLRSHFEQMTNSKTNLKPSGLPPPRPISPKPVVSAYSNHSKKSIINPAEVLPSSGRGAFPAPKLPPTTSRSLPVAVNATVLVSQSPAVTIEPPSSPPLLSSSTSSLAKAAPFYPSNSPRNVSPSGSLHRHFRTPSRPDTPVAECRRSPSLSGAPEPPPPRRSGEMRRDNQSHMPMGPPPTILRSDRSKSSSNSRPTFTLSPNIVPQSSEEKISPFNSPPDSPDIEGLPPQISQLHHATTDQASKLPPKISPFEPPPLHHSVAARRFESQPTSRDISPQRTGDLPGDRPILPVRSMMMAKTATRTSVDSPRPQLGLLDHDVGQDPKTRTVTPRKVGLEPSFPTPPKRIFSTPTSQSQTPPRTHGRSMTIDQMSDRTPIEFRSTPLSTAGSVRDRDAQASESTSTVGYSDTTASSLIGVMAYPDPSFSNRRPPHHIDGPHELPTKYDTRLLDACGPYACTSGNITRVWNLHTGELVLSVPHGETVKVLSMAFKPEAAVADCGCKLWLGNNVGELVELDIRRQITIAGKSTAHARREIVKIHSHLNEMWTLDDAGTLHVWGPDSKGSPDMDSLPQSYRVPKGHTFSMVVGHELWHATGKEIRIFKPTIDGRSQFQILQRPLSHESAGEVTSGAMLDDEPDHVYFGHSDGKISIYSCSGYTCIRLVNVSMYKINTLAGVGNYLWAAYNTGMIYVYDTTKDPWIVKKDWRAHDNPVISLIADRSSPYSMNRFQVISLGADNVLRNWDGFLQEDWLETEMQGQDCRFSTFEPMTALVMTWNAGASTPHDLRPGEFDSIFMRDVLQGYDAPEIFVFGFQELVDLEDKKTTARSFFKSKKKDSAEPERMSHQYRNWQDHLTRCLDEYLTGQESYHLLHSASLVGLFTCVFVKSRLRDRIQNVAGVEVKRGMGGLHGNKGALILRFMLDDSSLCFINCHLAAGQSHTKERNYDVSEILENAVLPIERDLGTRLDSYTGGGDGTMVLDHEMCMLNGDLNYRIDTMGRDAVVGAVKAGNLGKLLERDQLLVSKRKNPAFRLRAFRELPIDFAPTYKYDVGTDQYDTSEKRRSPAWCDRILSRCRRSERLRQITYRRHEVRVSDHRPVTALFEITVKKISPKKRAIAWEECLRKGKDVRANLISSAQFRYLTNIHGLSADASSDLLSLASKRR